MLVSIKLPGIRRIPVELEVGREPSAERVQALQQILASGPTRHRHVSRAGDMDFDLVAGLELQRLRPRSGKPNGEAVAPFRDLHDSLHGYTSYDNVYHTARAIKADMDWLSHRRLGRRHVGQAATARGVGELGTSARVQRLVAAGIDLECVARSGRDRKRRDQADRAGRAAAARHPTLDAAR